MPKRSSSDRETFRNSVKKIEVFLKSKFSDQLKSLTNRDLKPYSSATKFVRGWSITDTSYVYNVLIPEQFPYGVPRIAITDALDRDHDLSKEWPHVEDKGLLCLPAMEASGSDPVRVLNDLLIHAFQLVSEMSTNPGKVAEEFQREFLSYWQRRTDGQRILSLLDPQGDSRQIFSIHTQDGDLLVADSVDQLSQWHANHYAVDKSFNVIKGHFIRLDVPPVPPFPDTPDEFYAFLVANAPGMLDSYHRRILHPDTYPIILSASAESGTALVGISLEEIARAPKPCRGYRGTEGMPVNIRLQRLAESYDLRRHQIVRVDHDWIHGRALDKTQERLKKASVIVLGCGALGSYVATRLAQAGVGSLFLIDPDLVETANIGRHVLGAQHVAVPKVNGLAFELRRRLPHIQIQSHHGKWEDAIVKFPEKFESADLIVSAMASWASEGSLNEEEWGQTPR